MEEKIPADGKSFYILIPKLLEALKKKYETNSAALEILMRQGSFRFLIFLSVFEV